MLATALLGCTAAFGETSPYVIGISETYSHDSNFVRLPDGATLPATVYSKTDWIATTALFGGIDQPFGRQRFYANVSIRDNHFRYNDVYNNSAFDLVGGLDWSTIERVSGNLNFSSNRTLASFDRGTGNNAPNNTKNIEQTDQFAASVRVGVVTDLTFEGGVNHQTQRFSVVGNKLEQDVWNLGLRERFGGELTLGAGVRFVDGRYPDIDDSFKGHDLDLSANWVPSPISTVDVRLSFGKRSHSLASAQDFSGATGALSWKWQPTAKLTFNTQLNRSTGNESSFATSTFFATPISSKADNSRVTTTLALDASYEASAKIRLDLGYSSASRNLTNSLSVNAAQPSSATDGDRLQRLRFGARWAPTRTLEFNCNLSREARSADNATLTYAYQSNTVGCAAQLAVQP